MADPTIFQNQFVVQLILPFLLVFAVVFAILQKTKVLGDGKKQIDAIVALVVGLIVIAFVPAAQLIIYLVPIMAVSLVVLLLFYILWGSAFEGKMAIPKSIQYTIGSVAAVIIVTAVIIFTGAGDWIYKQFTTGNGSAIITNIVAVVIVVVAIVAVTVGGGKKSDDKDK